MIKTITYSLAHAASWDAGNRSMREANRTVWDAEDFATCKAEFDRLVGPPSTEHPLSFKEAGL